MNSAVAETKVELKAKFFRGFSDLSRLNLLEGMRNGPRSAGALAEAAGLTASNASMHLDCLYCCGLVDRLRRGRYVFYRIKSRHILRVLEQADRALTEVAERIEECTRYDS